MKPFVTFITYYDCNLKLCGDFLSNQLSVYALDNNYHFVKHYESNTTRRHASWAKFPCIFNKIPQVNSCNHGWVFCIDADTIILNDKYNMDFLEDTKEDVLFFEDWNGICCAAMAFRMTAWSSWFLDTLYRLGDIYPERNDEFGEGLGPKQEQNTIKVLEKYFPSIKDKIGFLPDWFISDSPNFENPSFLWHYAGARTLKDKEMLLNTEVKEKLLKKV